MLCSANYCKTLQNWIKTTAKPWNRESREKCQGHQYEQEDYRFMWFVNNQTWGWCPLQWSGLANMHQQTYASTIAEIISFETLQDSTAAKDPSRICNWILLSVDMCCLPPIESRQKGLTALPKPSNYILQKWGSSMAGFVAPQQNSLVV